MAYVKFPPRTCEVCGRGKGGANHKECSRVLQQRYAAARKPPKKLNAGNLEFLSTLEK